MRHASFDSRDYLREIRHAFTRDLRGTSPYLRIALAAAAPVAVSVIQWLMWDYLAPHTWFLFFPGIVFSAWIGGQIGGIAATLISVPLAWFFFLPSAQSFELKGDASAFSALLFAMTGCAMSILQNRASNVDQSAGRLRLLAETVERISSVRNLNALLSIVRSAARKLTGADGATFVFRENGYCHYVDEDAIGPLWKGQRFPLESCISGWSMLHASAVAIEDIYADSRIPHSAYRTTFVKSLSMVPIGRQRPIGAIGCYWAKRHLPTSEEIGLQQALADAASVGLANIDLYRQFSEARQTSEESAAAARESEISFKRLFDEAPVPLCFVAQNGQVGDFNHRFEQMFGYGAEDIPTLAEWRLRAFPDAEYRARIVTSWADAVAQATQKGSDIEPVECVIKCKEGANRTVLVSGIKLGDDLLTTFLDVTEWRLAETDLRRKSEELQRRNEELERYSRASTDREMEMIRLKQQINALCLQAGRDPPYPLAFIDSANPQHGLTTP